MSENNNNFDYQPLPPFKWFVLQNFPFIEADFDALTNWQLFCKIGQEINTIVDSQNLVGQQCENITNAFNQLKSYVDNYFDNLNVQEEINVKLDEMAEDGTLTNLIKDYVDPIYEAFETEINQTVDNFQTYFENEITDIDTRIQSVASGSPAGVYSTASDLASANPDHSKIYLVTADNKWYYYNTSSSQWTAGGTYQSAILNTADLNTLNQTASQILQNKYTPTIAGNVNSSGVYQINQANTSRITDYIPIRDNDTVFFMGNLGSGYNIVSFYNSSKTYISSGSIQGYGIEYGRYLKIPANAVYVVFCNYPTENMQTPYIQLYKQESVIDNVNYMENITSNLPYTDTPTLYGYVNTYAEFVKTQNAVRTGFIKVRNYKKIKYHTSISSAGYSIAYFNSSFEMISASSILGSGDVEEIVNIPDNVYYVVLSNYGDAVAHPYITLFNDENSYNISGKNILIFGDSITDCTEITINGSDETSAYSWRNPSNSYTNNGITINYSMWPKLLNLNYGCNEIRNYAKTGASYKSQTRTAGNERQNLAYQIEVAINDKNNPNDVFSVDNFSPDIIIFALGTNDGQANDTYESAMNKTVYEEDNITIDVSATLNNLNLSKFNEAVRYAYLKVKQEWPMAQIFVVLPIQRADNAVLPNDDIEKMAKRYGATIIDGFHNSGITKDLDVYEGIGTYLKDGLHPNEKGQNLLTRLIVTSLFANYVDFEGMNS